MVANSEIALRMNSFRAHLMHHRLESLLEKISGVPLVERLRLSVSVFLSKWRRPPCLNLIPWDSSRPTRTYELISCKDIPAGPQWLDNDGEIFFPMEGADGPQIGGALEYRFREAGSERVLCALIVPPLVMGRGIPPEVASDYDMVCSPLEFKTEWSKAPGFDIAARCSGRISEGLRETERGIIGLACYNYTCGWADDQEIHHAGLVWRVRWAYPSCLIQRADEA